jgi:hypothetical protein
MSHRSRKAAAEASTTKNATPRLPGKNPASVAAAIESEAERTDDSASEEDSESESHGRSGRETPRAGFPGDAALPSLATRAATEPLHSGKCLGHHFRPA